MQGFLFPDPIPAAGTARVTHGFGDEPQLFFGGMWLLPKTKKSHDWESLLFRAGLFGSSGKVLLLLLLLHRVSVEGSARDNKKVKKPGENKKNPVLTVLPREEDTMVLRMQMRSGGYSRRVLFLHTHNNPTRTIHQARYKDN